MAEILQNPIDLQQRLRLEEIEAQQISQQLVQVPAHTQVTDPNPGSDADADKPDAEKAVTNTADRGDVGRNFLYGRGGAGPESHCPAKLQASAASAEPTPDHTTAIDYSQKLRGISDDIAALTITLRDCNKALLEQQSKRGALQQQLKVERKALASLTDSYNKINRIKSGFLGLYKTRGDKQRTRDAKRRMDDQKRKVKGLENDLKQCEREVRRLEGEIGSAQQQLVSKKAEADQTSREANQEFGKIRRRQRMQTAEEIERARAAQRKQDLLLGASTIRV